MRDGLWNPSARGSYKPMSRNILSDYLAEIARISATRSGTGEISYYGALAGAMNAAGEKSKPRVFCVPNLKNRAAGFPGHGPVRGRRRICAGRLARRPPAGARGRRGGRHPRGPGHQAEQRPGAPLSSPRMVSFLSPTTGILCCWVRIRRASPKRGSASVSIVSMPLLSLLSRAAPAARPDWLPGSLSFWNVCCYTRHPSSARGRRFLSCFLCRDALARVGEHASLPAFADLRSALQQALGLTFDGPKGEHLFRSTLVQTLFYGVFSAWVEVARRGEHAFDWRAAGWSLHVPFVDTLFQRIATPQHLKPLGLEEPLAWAAGALNRVDRTAFFARFEDADAVRYFYEPFLAASNPSLGRNWASGTRRARLCGTWWSASIMCSAPSSRWRTGLPILPYGFLIRAAAPGPFLWRCWTASRARCAPKARMR